ncbi:MAG: hypothetical protein SOX50_06145 [Terrisporobacter othiniensis]|uniref:hypothetical protein n=1 Tax=Terrisporobacter othiniensis TaxID=1577792 RepID=UPI002A75B466|nr:hypothetical protein [Terrisporobacter othiniensis]MDY3372837.1 hypothetical protein [Terrisporobacter othiniensis]
MKIKGLNEVVSNLRALADSLESVEVVKENVSAKEKSVGKEDRAHKEGKVEKEDRSDKGGRVEKEKKVDKQDKVDKIDKADQGAKESEVKEISLEEVRAVLAKKSQAGFTDEIRSMIKGYGCNKLSKIDSKYYDDILKAAEVMINE